MTPMVDLAFLLLTFFILTATFSKHKVMPLVMPDKINPGDPPPQVTAKDVLNLVLAEDDKVYWWIGVDPPVQTTNYSNKGIRNLLLEQKAKNPKIMVLLKPQDDCKYQNLVDILDELEITGISKHAIVDSSRDDEALIALAR
jgi:biopolymer transport protein ExbD